MWKYTYTDTHGSFGTNVEDLERLSLFIETTPIAKRSHVCKECERIICKNEKYTLYTFTLDGKSETHRMCTNCKFAASTYFGFNVLMGDLWNVLEVVLDTYTSNANC